MNINQEEPKFFPPKEEVGQEPVGSDADVLYDPLLRDLEESMPQGVPNSTRHEGITYGRRATDFDTDFASLDALLGESVAAKELEEQYKKDRELRKRGYAGLTKEEVDFCNSRMHAFEMAREWDADRCIAIFVQYVCERCETGHTIFSRLMEHHQHRRVKTTHRWLTVKDSKLPLETVFDQKTVPMCTACIGELGIADPHGDVPWLDDVLNGEEAQDEYRDTEG